MPPFISIAGHKFGRLTAVHATQMAARVPYRQTKWLCLCECGGRKEVAYSSLKQGFTRSCGCKQEDNLKRVRLSGGLAAMRTQIRRYKRQAAERLLCWELTELECRELFAAHCHYCGAKPSNMCRPSNGSKYGGCFYSGIDRIDADQGYRPGNVVPACFTCNRAKSVLGYRQFIEWIGRCSAHLKNRDRKASESQEDNRVGRLFA